MVLLLNGGSLNACNIKLCITLLCIPKQSMWQNGFVPSLLLLLIVISITSGICHACFWVNKILSKSLFFPDRTEGCSFHKLPDFSCVKRVFYICICLEMHLYVHCASTVLECSCCRIQRNVAAPIEYLCLKVTLFVFFISMLT